MIKTGLYNPNDTIVGNTFELPDFDINIIEDGVSIPFDLTGYDVTLVFYKDSLCNEPIMNYTGIINGNNVSFTQITAPLISGTYYYRIKVTKGSETDDLIHGKILVNKQ